MRPKLFTVLALIACLGCEAADYRFTVVLVDPAAENLQLFMRDDQGEPFRQFGRFSTWLQRKGKKLSFVMNAGMYHSDFSPVGLLVVEGWQVPPLNTSAGFGNFFLKPNGVFLLSPAGPKFVETGEYPSVATGVHFATQSGPLLLRNGIIHPALNPASTSRFIRNGVDVSGSGAVFVISEQPVSFLEFAVFLRDALHCKDALYFDGVVSNLYSVDLNRDEQRVDLGLIFGVTIDQTPSPLIPRTLLGQPGAVAHLNQ